MKFSMEDFSVKCDQIPADLVIFTEEILHGKLQFLYNKEILIKVLNSQETCERQPLYSRKQSLTLSWRRLLSYRNQSTDLRSKLMDWFPYDNGLRHERVN